MRMRIAYVVHGLPPYARTGIETHASALADAVVHLDHWVEVFAPRHLPGLALYAQRREMRNGWAVTWVNVPGVPDKTWEKDMAEAFAAFLDRERPEVVHFEQLQRVGMEAVEEAKKRGIPTVYMAHDYFAVGDCLHLLAPDLSDAELGDRESEARALLAQRHLEGIQELGEHKRAARKCELGREAWVHLQSILHGPSSGVRDLDRAQEEVKQRLERRRAAFAAIDCRFATSRHLAKRLSGTLGRAVDWRPAGIETKRVAMAGSGGRVDGPVRFGYMGAIDKHQGLHLLLGAFADVQQGRAELQVWGDSRDRAYLRAMRERAEEVGATWNGPYRSEDASEVLSGFDVLVVPTLWVEGAPFEIRQAFAAHRPVIVPRTDAIEEIVRDDVDGIVYERGDRNGLMCAMIRFVEEQWLLDRLEIEIEPQKDIGTEAREWVETYQTLVEEAAKGRTHARLPAHLESFAGHYRQLDQRPTRELFAQVANGLTKLAPQMGLKAELGEFLALALGRGSRLRDGVVEDRRAMDWLQASVEQQEEARRELEQRAAWHEEQIQELMKQIERHEEQVEKRKQDYGRLQGDFESLVKASQEREEKVVALQAAQEELGRTLVSAKQAVASLEEERDFFQQTLEEGARELSWLRERILGGEGGEQDGLSDREAIERHFASLQEELDGIRRHEGWLSEEVSAIVSRLTSLGDAGDAGDAGGAGSAGDAGGEDSAPQDAADEGAMTEAIASGLETLKRLAEELTWRREEMAEARRASQTLFARVAGGELASRARSWADGLPRDRADSDPGTGDDDGSHTEAAPDERAIATPLEEPEAPLRAESRSSSEPVEDTSTDRAHDDRKERS